VDDERVVEQAVGGSREAFDELDCRHRGQIYALIRTVTGHDSDAEDLTQECFVRAYVAIVRFRQDGAFRTWLTRIAVNVARTYLARQRRGRRSISLEVASVGEHRISDALVVRSDVEATVSRRQAIVRALAMLPEDSRIALTLRDMQGLEYHEIAAILNVPIGTIESRVFRARRQLRPLLQQWLPRSSSTHGGLAVRPDDAAEGSICQTERVRRRV
jgi:RNA polymerase sigma-70 factor, ECF subfamily